MSNRRRMLMAIANQFKWLPYSYEYLYHDLVPVTIDSKSVKNKAKVATIEGNSVVENQLIDFDNTTFHNDNPTIYTLAKDNSNKTITLTGTASGSVNNKMIYFLNCVANHKYLFVYDILSSIAFDLVYDNATFNGTNVFTNVTSISANTKTRVAMEYIASSTENTFWRIARGLTSWSVGNTMVFSNIQIIDLTLRYGPGNEPTTLTDNRVQALLNRGYIPYNTGEIKSVDIGLFSSEPYNLCVDDWESYSSTQLENKDYIKVVNGQSYTVESTIGAVILLYDKDFNYIDYYSVSNTVRTLTLNCEYVKFRITTTTVGNYICFHRTGTRTGYAPYQSFTPIAFKYQGGGVGTAHDTMEISKDNVVFGKNIGGYTFSGSESWNYYDAGVNSFFYTGASNIPSGLGNTTCLTSNGIKLIMINVTNAISVRAYISDNSQLSSSTNMNQVFPSGTTICYELATPQVITIPRKHLGVVDLGTISDWTFKNNNRISSDTLRTLIQTSAGYTSIPNMYCGKYTTDTPYNLEHTPQDKSMSLGGNGYSLLIYDTELIGLTTSQIQAKLFGIYLFYETNSEVADILDTLDIEAGGTVNANWFSWVENQLVTNGNFADSSGWRIINGTASVSNNVLTQTITSIGAHKWGNGVYVESFNPPLEHYFLCICKVKPKYSGNCLIGTGYTSNLSNDIPIVANIWNYIYAIVKNTTNSGSESRFSIAVDCTTNYQVGDTIDYKDCCCVDLTLALPTDTPTDINDPRIQYILDKSYIPTNTTGTYKLVDCEVLPNVDFSIKCK